MPTYTDLRQAHLKITLKAWWAGLDRALIALVAALQFMLTALVVMVVYGLSQGLGLLLESGTDLGHRAADIVAAFGIEPYLDAPLGTLSAGTARKLMLAAALITAPPVMITPRISRRCVVT